MKRILILVILILLVACAAPSAPVVVTEPAIATNAPIDTQEVEAQTTEPVKADGAEVKIILDDNTINASQTAFQVGVPYVFVIENQGGHAHNFNITQPVSAAGGLKEAFALALLAIGRDELQSGESVTVEFTFPESALTQSLEFSCLIQRHYDDGMFLGITVTK